MTLQRHVDVPSTHSTILDTLVLPEGLALTGTGLDALLDLAAGDQNLGRRVSAEDFAAAAQAMSAMNAIIVMAVEATGVAADGTISAADVYDISDAISANWSLAWTILHGDDEDGVETGFHLVQNDGAVSTLFGDNAINTVADGLYHLGFGYDHGRLINEDGNRNAEVDDVAFWLDTLLSAELESGVFAAPPAPAIATTGTGLDLLVDTILEDPGLNFRVPLAEIEAGAAAANTMNAIIVDGIKALGLANDGPFTAADVASLSDWIAANHAAEFIAAHGDDEDGEETGFHLVQNDGAIARMFGDKAVDTVADGIYHLVFGHVCGRLTNEDGNANARLEEVAWWLNELLADDFATLANPDADKRLVGTTGTGLDRLVDIINGDDELNRRLPGADIDGGAEAANAMNEIIVESIEALGIAADGVLTTAEVYALSDHIRENHYDAFALAHGDDEDGEETGFHLVQNDGARTEIFGDNAVNTVADGIYHLVFGYDRDRLINEDGNRNARVEEVAYWLNALLKDDLAAWKTDAEAPAPEGLAQLTAMIADDPELNRRLPLDEILDGIAAAQAMNAIVLEAIEATGVAANGTLTAADLRDVSDWIKTNRYEDWVLHHGDDEAGVETGFHLVQNDGAVTRMFAANGVDAIADGIYHLGFGYRNDRLINEDGNSNAQLTDVAFWLNALLADQLASGELAGDFDPYDVASTGTGLDAITNAVFEDARFARDFSTSKLAQAAEAADGLNDILLTAIHQTGAANDGEFTEADIALLDEWIAANALPEWDALNGVNDRDSDGFRALLWEGGTALAAGERAVDDVARLLYSLGHGIKYDAVYDADGKWVQKTDRAADMLNRLLAEELEDGSLFNAALAAVDPAAFADALAYALPAPLAVNAEGGQIQVDHDPSLALSSGAVAVTFATEDVSSWDLQTLISKDRSGYGTGGHFSLWVSGGGVEARLQTGDATYKLRTDSWILKQGQAYDVVVNFGPDGAELWLNGERVAVNGDAAFSWEGNAEPMAIGAARMWTNSDAVPTSGLFRGEIASVAIYDRELTFPEVQGLNLSPEPMAAVGAAEALPEADAMQRLGDGLAGEAWDVAENFSTIDQLIALADEAPATHAFAATRVEFSGGSGQSIGDFIAQGGALTDGDGTAAMEQAGLRLTGYIWIDAGEHRLTVRSDDGFALRLGGEELMRFAGARGDAPTSEDAVFEGGLYEIELFYYENGGAQSLTLLLDGEVVDASRLYSSVEAFLAAEPYVEPDPDPRLTGTGLDAILGWIEEDPGLHLRVSHADREDALDAAAQMNAIIVEGIKAIGAADDGELSVGDVYDLATWINANRYDAWLVAHGDDEDGVETGFHLVQGDGDEAYVYGEAAIDTVADGIFHLGFGYRNDRLINEDGNNNQRVERVALWLSDLLADDLAAGTLASGNAPADVTPTGTGLDALVEIARADQELARRLPGAELREALDAMTVMNEIILEGVEALGLANDGRITRAEVAGLSDWVAANHYDTWLAAHGDDEDGVETGFHLVQNDGAITRLYAANAINTVADGLYHLGFGHDRGRLINEDGDHNASLTDVGAWLTQLLADDMAALANPFVDPIPLGTTGTGLDTMVELIGTDEGLHQRITLAEIQGGAAAADAMNHMIVASIEALGYANDGVITDAEVRSLASYVEQTYGDGPDSPWVIAHGDDEEGIETGFHLVQNDGGLTRLFAQAQVNTIADGIYHLGFGYVKDNLINEDGNRNAAVSDVAAWLNALLTEEDFASLANPDVTVFAGTTGTGLDQWVTVILEDPELQRRISATEIEDGARAADAMNAMIVDGVIATGIARDGSFDAADVRTLSDYIVATHEMAWIEAHGDDEDGIETGFHLVQNDGAFTRLYGENAINTVFDGAYHLGFGYNPWRLINEDGDSNQRLEDVAYWLEAGLAAELASGALVTGDSADPYVAGSTGTGLDELVSIITGDEYLALKYGNEHIAEAASAADALNGLLIDAIRTTGVADDGEFSGIDIQDLADHILTTDPDGWRALHGAEDGFENAIHAQSGLFGRYAIRDVADALYNIGFGYHSWGSLKTRTGGSDWKVHQVAEWMNALMADDLASGALLSEGAAPVDVAVLTSGPIEVHAAGDAVTLAGAEELPLAEGTVVVSFRLDSLNDNNDTLLSRDFGGYEDGAFTLAIRDEKLMLRAEDGGRAIYLMSEDWIAAGEDYTAAFTFGAEGLDLYLNGEKVALNRGVDMDWSGLAREFVAGAATWYRSDARPDKLSTPMDGEILAVDVYDRAMSGLEVRALNASGALDGRQPGAAALAAESLEALGAQGDGLSGVLTDLSASVRSMLKFEGMAAEADPTLVFDATALDYSGGSTLSEFLGADAAGAVGDGSAAADTFGLQLSGFVFVEAGTHVLDVASDDGFRLAIGGEVVSQHAGQRSFRTSSVELVFEETGLYEIELGYFENHGAQGLKVELDGAVLTDEILFSLDAGADFGLV